MDRNYTEQEMRETLGKDYEPSEIVNRRLQDIYKQIGAGRKSVKNKEGRKKTGGRFPAIKKGLTVTAAVLAGGILLCASNPALAAKIPIIGAIFDRVEQDVTFSGNYSKKDNLLTTEDESTGMPVNTQFSVEDNGVTMTASEIYSDGYSIYLTLDVRSENGGFNSMPSHYTADDKTTAQTLYIQGVWLVNSYGSEIPFLNNSMEGKVVSDTEFIGMMKLDLPDDGRITEDTLSLQMTQIGFDNKEFTPEMLENEGAANTIIGAWNIDIPVQADETDIQVIDVNEKNEKGFSIDQVIVTPYQVKVLTTAPYTTRKDSEITKKEFEELWGEKNKEIQEQGESEVLYDDYLMDKIYEDFGVSVFTQDGNRLMPISQSERSATFAVQNNEIIQLQVFIGENGIDTMKEKDMGSMKEKAIVSATIEVQ
ncbi:DUF4179 domain-containing protein [Robinsoniella peoriensis]|uniref:DUF4179 domain-containing protein n=1 Tax=Robinsoniella peoriensis TaxID=180332 RepID=A0A4U8Q8M5_9FIRM|nr:DUF4179 domain-containing protein [Robinsoniella peoriensis]MDU7028757.1 DUF4179 domain-containing protein [Clostridiales bacterium]TLC98125.1 hypothetical protein DSM106044_05031 [Robinsoniella peoriensis]